MHLPISQCPRQRNRHLCARQNFPYPRRPLSLAWLVNTHGVAFRRPLCNLQSVLIAIASDYLLNPNQNIAVRNGYQGMNDLPCPVIVRLNGVGGLIRVKRLGISNARHRLSTTNEYMCAGGTHGTPWQWSSIRGVVKRRIVR